MEALRTTPGEMRADTDRKQHPAKAGLLAGRCVETAHFRQHKAHAWAGLLLSLVAGAGLNGWAQTVGGPKIPLSDLADMSLEDLTKMEVTSVSKHKEKLADAPAAIFVITQDDIHRSGVTTIAEALRLALAAIERKQKMVHPADFDVRVVQTYGNAGAENRRHGGPFRGNKDLPGMKINFRPLARYCLRCRGA